MELASPFPEEPVLQIDADVPFQGLGRNGPFWKQVVRRITRDLQTHSLIETLNCNDHSKLVLHRRSMPGCGHNTSASRDIETTSSTVLILSSQLTAWIVLPPSITQVPLLPFSFGGGGGAGDASFSRLGPL